MVRITAGIAPVIEQQFIVQPCFRCHEFSMQLLEISPHGRSIHYQCHHCKKKMRALAGTPEAVQVLDFWNKLTDLSRRGMDIPGLKNRSRIEMISIKVNFTAPAGLLPFEQSSRSPVPESIRTEVWRRDGGQCVECGSKENLQFDHVIPVSKGGATTTLNLQLLCQPCNGAKSNRI